jgi:3'-5' exoribonuclease
VSADRTSRPCPTEKTFIADLCGDCKVASYFVCEAKEVATTRDGRAFLKLVLRDASGNVKALQFDPSDEALEDLCAGDVVKIIGNYTVSAQYGPQIKVQQIGMLAEGDYDPATLVAVSPVPLDELKERLAELVASVCGDTLRALLERALDPAREPGATYLVAPAAVRHHHAYLYGLLEHSLVVSEVAAAVADRIPSVDRDMVVAGGLLHDIGKTQAYSTDPFRPGLTDKGRLHGEIVLGQAIVADLLRELPDVSDETVTRLLHVIVSHHGQREKGSPAVPMTREAIVVHYCDDMTARLAAFDEVEAGTPVAERWTGFNRMMDTMLYLGDAEATGDTTGASATAGEGDPRASAAVDDATPAIDAATPAAGEDDPAPARDDPVSSSGDDTPPAAAALFD